MFLPAFCDFELRPHQRQLLLLELLLPLMLLTYVCPSFDQCSNPKNNALRTQTGCVSAADDNCLGVSTVAMWILCDRNMMQTLDIFYTLLHRNPKTYPPANAIIGLLLLPDQTTVSNHLSLGTKSDQQNCLGSRGL